MDYWGRSYSNKEPGYFAVERNDIVALIPEGNNIILEIGCGNGATGLLLKKAQKVSRLIGIELEPQIAERARAIFDQVITGNIEEIEIPNEFGLYDYVICGDILEHLKDPWRVLKKLHRCLKEGGGIIASIPNVRNWLVLKDLVFRGEWKYIQNGILDSTHLRFFTRRSMERLFVETGFCVVHVEHFGFGWKADKLNKVTFSLFEEFLAQRYLVKAIR